MTRALVVAVAVLVTACAGIHHVRAEGTPYTVRFTMPVGEGQPVEFHLLIDGEDVGFVSNQAAPTIIDVDLAGGQHLMELRNMIFYHGMGVKDIPHQCSRTFFVAAQHEMKIWAKLLGSDVSCGVA